MGKQGIGGRVWCLQVRKEGEKERQKNKNKRRKKPGMIANTTCSPTAHLRPNPAQAATSHGSSSNAAYDQAPPYQHPHSSAPAGMTGGTTTAQVSREVLFRNPSKGSQHHNYPTIPTPVSDKSATARGSHSYPNFQLQILFNRIFHSLLHSQEQSGIISFSGQSVLLLVLKFLHLCCLLSSRMLMSEAFYNHVSR